MNPKVDTYLTEGCGRCSLGGTPECKVHHWPKELLRLRMIVLDCGLTEELKWGVLCYTFGKSNIAVIAAFKEYCALSFFKGALLQDANGILEKPGENTQSARIVRFTSVREIVEIEPILKAYIYEAIEVEKAGLQVDFKKNPEPVPEEFQAKLDESPDLKAAFALLTAGRQRAYIIHFSQPKQSKTRVSRIEKCIPQILNGKGLHDR
uniref:YdeI/OmpD-associated family protein n=1 Tax=Roseihalotalea indica TaxID=2867963 RepID=A0AA49GN78_9BACT|nr:YdeI/OmpD-associated family protein [Tunicatimonas sp. TK19036]